MKFLPLLLLLVSTRVDGRTTQTQRGKLLYILMDGFRYDYVDRQAHELPGFKKFLSEGVKAEYVNPLYPSISYPTWTTLVTGLYAENHNVLGNYFYDPADKTEFSLFDADTTGKKKWWTSEPLWTTATKAGLRTALFLWARCDVPFDGVLPDTCERFYRADDDMVELNSNLDKALGKLQAGYDLVQLYTPHLDTIGHAEGPDTEALKYGMRQMDGIMQRLDRRITRMGMTNQINIVIVSDHGMANTAPGTIVRTEMDDYLPPNSVESIADKGTFINIKVNPGYLDEVYSSLKRMPGVSVYKKEEIPEHFHVKKAKYMHDILIVADINNFVMASRRPEQLPKRNDDYVYYGVHGYKADEMKMKSIFFAKGPAFKKNHVIDPIEIVDIYQVLTTVLGISPQPNNGTWSHVRDAFVQDYTGGAEHVAVHISLMVLCLLVILF